jgi:LPS export ABC transporter protein LptC
MWLGLGLLGGFFLASSVIIYNRNQARIPSSPQGLSKEQIEGIQPQTPPASDLKETPAPGGVGFVLNQFHRSLVRDGKIVWEVFGKRGSYDASNNIVRVEEPDLTVNQKNGDTIKLSAGRADLSLAGTELSTADLFDRIVLIYKGETTVKAERATYNKTTGHIDIPVPVELDSPMFNLKGNKLKALTEPQEITVSGGVHSVIKPRVR